MEDHSLIHLSISQIKDVAPWHLQCLAPEKLATFYRLVGGDYDPLFVETPHPTLSFIYQSLGCFHTLQPTADAFVPPSVPALTSEGYVRWQTIQLLLGPDEHVPYLQQALKRFDIVNPVASEVFPKVLPREAFPAVPDEEMTKWHECVRELLEQEAESEQAMLGSGAGDHDHGSSHNPSRDPPVEWRIPVDDTPDYFSQAHRGSHKGPSEVAHVYPGPRSAFRWPAKEHQQNHRAYQPRPRSHTERPHRDDRHWPSPGSKAPERRHRSAHRHQRARSPSTVSISSTSSESSTEETSAPRRASHHSDLRRLRNDRLFPPSTFRDRRHSYHHIHQTPTSDPPQQPHYGPHLPSTQVQISREQGGLPRGTARGLDLRVRDVESGLAGFSGSAPSTPGGYPGRAPVRYVESGRDTGADRPLIRRFVTPVKGVGGRRYIAP